MHFISVPVIRVFDDTMTRKKKLVNMHSFDGYYKWINQIHAGDVTRSCRGTRLVIKFSHDAVNGLTRPSRGLLNAAAL